jgi:TetR/AcrR family transcriptional repressor of nem operon
LCLTRLAFLFRFLLLIVELCNFLLLGFDGFIGTATLDRYISSYLASEHRDQPGKGCPLAALACEMPRQSTAVRDTFTAGLRGMIRQVSSRMDTRLKQRQRDEKALATVASLVGALVLARAVNDRKLSDDIMHATKTRLDD